MFNKTVSGNPPTIATNTATANAAARNDRLVAHRRIDLICDLAGSSNLDQHNHSSSSDTGTMSQEMNSSSSRAAKMLLTNKCSFNNYNQQHASISGASKPGGSMSAAIVHSSNNHTTNIQ